MVVLGNTLAAMAAADQSSSISNAYIVDEQDHYNEEWVRPFEPRSDIQIKTDEKFSDYYELFEEIGEGKFGKVYRCVEKRTGLTLAAKCIRLKKDADLQKVEKEVNIMTRMRHKCIAQIYDAFATSTNNVILIMEIVEGGELFLRVSEDHYILTELAVAMVVIQICQAIQYIHSLNIIHLDLKPENIMVLDKETSNQIKLIDFGLAQYYDGRSDLLFMAGTPEFAAPEVIKYEPLDFHTDMWSVGVIAYILLSGESPFLGENVAVTYCNVEKGQWSFCEEFDHNCISDEARDFIAKLLVVDKSQRMLADECLLHPWLVKCKERARSASPYTRPLDTAKLRSYVRNKRFRRAVFGVLFINTVLRTMMRTFRERKSRDGMAYVENMMQAATARTEQKDKDLESIVYSQHRQLSPATVDGAAVTHGEGTVDTSSFSSKPTGALLKKKVRRVPKPKLEEAFPRTESTSSATTTAPPTTTTSASEAESEQASQHASSVSIIRRKIERTKRSKSATRKSSSNEQQRRPKKPKPSTPSSELADVKKECVAAAPTPSTPHPPSSAGAVASKVATLEADRALSTSPRRQQKVVFNELRDQPREELVPVARPEGTSKPKNLVSSMLKRLEEMNASNGDQIAPMKMAVSGFTPTVRTRQNASTHEGMSDGKRDRQPYKKIVVGASKAGYEVMSKARVGTLATPEPANAANGKPVMLTTNGFPTPDRNHAQENGGGAKVESLGEVPKTKIVKVLRKKKSAQSSTRKLSNEEQRNECCDALDFGRRTHDKLTFDFSESSSSTQDAFDFSLLRMKLQNRILGLKDEEDSAREEANRLKFEERLQLNYTSNINTKRAMRKWTSLDKRNADRPLLIDSQCDQ